MIAVNLTGRERPPRPSLVRLEGQLRNAEIGALVAAEMVCDGEIRIRRLRVRVAELKRARARYEAACRAEHRRATQPAKTPTEGADKRRLDPVARDDTGGCSAHSAAGADARPPRDTSPASEPGDRRAG